MLANEFVVAHHRDMDINYRTNANSGLMEHAAHTLERLCPQALYLKS
jgi:hypothetical protein